MKTCEDPEGCENEGVIGWGSPPATLCMQHFEERLKGVRQTVDRALQICDESR